MASGGNGGARRGEADARLGLTPMGLRVVEYIRDHEPCAASAVEMAAALGYSYASIRVVLSELRRRGIAGRRWVLSDDVR